VHRGGTRRKLLFTAVLVVVALLAIRATAGLEGAPPLGGALRDVLAPVQNVIMKAGQGLGGVFSYPAKIYVSVRHNEELTEQVTILEGELRLMKDVQLENERLQELLEFRTGTADTYVTEVAAVVNRDPGNWFGKITVNKGANHGIKENMPVITPAGLVGRVLTVSRYSSEVLLITDPRSGAGSMVQDTRVPGLVEGQAAASTNLRMAHIPGALEVERDQVVITSGLGSVFPKGVPIGTVTRVEKEPSGLFKTALIKPFVDFHRLEEVLIITELNRPKTPASE